MTGEQFKAVELALRLFIRCECIIVAGNTRSGEVGTMTIDRNGAFAFEGNLEDMISATQESGMGGANG